MFLLRYPCKLRSKTKIFFFVFQSKNKRKYREFEKDYEFLSKFGIDVSIDFNFSHLLAKMNYKSQTTVFWSFVSFVLKLLHFSL